MNFCPECDFMLYKRLHGTDDTVCKLEEYCKNCGFIGSPVSHSKIYGREYAHSFIKDKIVSNKYTIYDNTLPRLAHSCKCTHCVYNVHRAVYELHSSVEAAACNSIIGNIPEDLSDRQLLDIMIALVPDTPSEAKTSSILSAKQTESFALLSTLINIGVSDTTAHAKIYLVSELGNANIYMQRLKLTEMFIFCVPQSLSVKMDTVLCKSFIESIPVKKLPDTYGEDYTLTAIATADYIKEEVLYIKYDKVNMKFMYICTNCGISW